MCINDLALPLAMLELSAMIFDAAVPAITVSDCSKWHVICLCSAEMRMIRWTGGVKVTDRFIFMELGD